jgi:hypothetical protein
LQKAVVVQFAEVARGLAFKLDHEEKAENRRATPRTWLASEIASVCNGLERSRIISVNEKPKEK